MDSTGACVGIAGPLESEFIGNTGIARGARLAPRVSVTQTTANTARRKTGVRGMLGNVHARPVA